MPPGSPKVLVVEDDPRMMSMLKQLLRLEDFQTYAAENAEEALRIVCRETPDIALLDIRLPGMDGMDLCKRIREFSELPVIMVTAKDSEAEKLQGLESGADDYLTKPFSNKELIARIRAVLRRSHQCELHHNQPSFRLDDLVVDFTRKTATLAGEEVELTAAQYRLLSYLARHAGIWLTPDQILEAVWGTDYAGEYRILRVNITRLRKKLGDNPSCPRFIATKVNLGYRMLSVTDPVRSV